jgi:hypothetical protein
VSLCVATGQVDASTPCSGAAGKVALLVQSVDTVTGVILFDVVGKSGSGVIGDSTVFVRHHATADIVARQTASVVVPARIGPPPIRESSNVVRGFNGLFNSRTIPSFGDVLPPLAQCASMYLTVSRVLVMDQFGQPIGDADLYGGVPIFEGRIGLDPVLASVSPYSVGASAMTAHAVAAAEMN